MICPACGHEHTSLCAAEVMVQQNGVSFHLHCWCDGRSGPTVRWSNPDRDIPMFDVYQRVEEQQ